MKTKLLLLVCSALPLGAEAALIYSGPQNIPIPFTFDGVYLNPLSMATAFAEPASFDTEPWINFGFGGVDVSNGALLQPVVQAGLVLENVTALSLVDSSRSFTPGASASSTHLGGSPAHFTAGVTGYVGFAFQPAVSGPTHYGWAEVVFRDNGTPGAVVSWTYEDVPNTTVSVGVIPEPTTSLLLGSLALLCSRRRRWLF
jgi:hypothetical protein